MADKLFLELVSPEKLLVSSDVDNVFARGAGGAFGLYPDHSPFCTELVPCVLTYAIGQETFKVIVSKGFLEVADNKVNVLAERAVYVKDIDAAKIKAEYDALSAELAGEIADEEIRKEKETALKFCETALNI